MRVRLLYLPPNKIYSVHACSHCRFIPRVLSYTVKAPSRCHGEEIISSSPKVLVTGLSKTMQRPI
ncbi:hypothetical protein DV832_22170 [Escherichia coli]|nr:hypothetical protein [Escherichia coli]